MKCCEIERSKARDTQCAATDCLNLLKSNKTKRKKSIWSETSVRALLSNTHYKGYYKYTDKKSGETITTLID